MVFYLFVCGPAIHLCGPATRAGRRFGTAAIGHVKFPCGSECCRVRVRGSSPPLQGLLRRDCRWRLTGRSVPGSTRVRVRHGRSSGGRHSAARRLGGSRLGPSELRAVLARAPGGPPARPLGCAGAGGRHPASWQSGSGGVCGERRRASWPHRGDRVRQ